MNAAFSCACNSRAPKKVRKKRRKMMLMVGDFKPIHGSLNCSAAGSCWWWKQSDQVRGVHARRPACSSNIKTSSVSSTNNYNKKTMTLRPKRRQYEIVQPGCFTTRISGYVIITIHSLSSHFSNKFYFLLTVPREIRKTVLLDVYKYLLNVYQVQYMDMISL